VTKSYRGGVRGRGHMYTGKEAYRIYLQYPETRKRTHRGSMTDVSKKH